MEKIRFVPLTFGSDTKTYVRADTIVELSEDGDKTSVYISNSDVPIKVKESVGEILAKIRGTAWEQAPIDRIEPGTDGYAYKMTISNGKEFEKQNCDDAVSRKEVFNILSRNYCSYSVAADGSCVLGNYREDIYDDIKALPSVTPVACIAEFRFSKEDIQEIVEEKIKDIVVERKKGEWIIDEDEDNRIWNCHCSECKKDPQDYIFGNENWWLIKSQLPNYCPNCGLEMQGVEE